MVMRMTDKQKNVARKVGEESFHAALALSHQLPNNYPLTPKWAYVDDPDTAIDWEDHFSRSDISDGQKEELTSLFNQAYEEAYASYMFEAMIPETKAQFDRRIKEQNLLANMLSLGLASWGGDEKDHKELEDWLESIF